MCIVCSYNVLTKRYNDNHTLRFTSDNAYQWFNSSNNSRSSTQITSMDVSADVAVALIVSPSNFSKVKDDHMKAREPGHTVSARPGDATCALTEVMS